MADEYGGGIYSLGTLSMADTTLLENAAYKGGGIHAGGNATITDSHILGNSATSDGGGAHLGLSVVTITNSDFRGNNSDSWGAGLGSRDSHVTIMNSTVSDNRAKWGGGIGVYKSAWYRDSTCVLIDSIVTNNSASRYGGGIHNYGSLTVTDSEVSFNQSGLNGAGIYAYISDISIAQTVIKNNTVDADSRSDGGGIWGQDVSLDITDSQVLDNFAPGGGGGLAFDGESTVTIEGTTIRGNRTDGPGAGVGIWDGCNRRSATRRGERQVVSVVDVWDRVVGFLFGFDGLGTWTIVR